MGTENQGTIERWEDDLRIGGKVCISRFYQADNNIFNTIVSYYYKSLKYILTYYTMILT